MQIVINISEEEYNLIKMKSYIKIGGVMSQAEWLIIKGTPLPKGHGDLKDIAEIERLWQKGDYDSIVSALIFAPTIVEADKEVEE